MTSIAARRVVFSFLLLTCVVSTAGLISSASASPGEESAGAGSGKLVVPRTQLEPAPHRIQLAVMDPIGDDRKGYRLCTVDLESDPVKPGVKARDWSLDDALAMQEYVAELLPALYRLEPGSDASREAQRQAELFDVALTELVSSSPHKTRSPGRLQAAGDTARRLLNRLARLLDKPEWAG